MKYEKADAEVIYFTNRDVIATSGSETGGCKNKGQDNGNGCTGVSGDCPTKHAWK